eukprot:8091-Heterococcus_DN1.PRE.3
MIILLSSPAHAQQAAAAQHTQLMLALPVETVERMTEALLLELSNGSSTAASSNGKSSNCNSSDAAKQQSEAAATLLFSEALSSTAASSGAVCGVDTCLRVSPTRSCPSSCSICVLLVMILATQHIPQHAATA